MTAMHKGKLSTMLMSAKDEKQRDRWLDALSDVIYGVLVTQPAICTQPFRNSIPLKIMYSEGAPLQSCDVLTAETASNMPIVHFKGRADCLYTLVMVDIDYPSRENSAHEHMVHWMIVNILGSGGEPTNATSGTTVFPYHPIDPFYESGMHRYIFLLFKQGKRISEGEFLDRRHNFDIRGWATLHGHGDPVGIHGFESSWDTYVDNLHENLNITPPSEYLSPLQRSNIEKALLKEQQEQLQEQEQLLVLAQPEVTEPTLSASFAYEYKHSNEDESLLSSTCSLFGFCCDGSF